MASTNAFLTLVSTVQTDAIGSTISTGYIPYVSTAGRQAYRNMLSLGLSTNQTYNNLSNGSYSNWINAASSLSLSTIKDVAMSSSGQYQLIVVGSSNTLYLSSNSGVTWSALGSSNGLPATSTAYTYGAISANGQYIIVCVNAGSVYVSSNYGTTFVNVSLPSTGPTNWFAFENNTTDSAGSIIPTAIGTMYYVPGKVGNFALNLVNPASAAAVNYLRGSWTAPANLSITFWMCPQYLNSNYQIIFSAFNTGIQVYISPGNAINLAYPSGSSTTLTTLTSSIVLSANTWYHIAVIFQTNGTCSYYINGTLASSGANNGGYGTITPLNVFSLGTYDQSTGYAYTGYIDDLRFYNYAIVPSGVPPQNFNYAAMSGTGQYMVVSASGNLAYSGNYGQTWQMPYGITTAGQMSSLAVSNTGQYMLAENGGTTTPTSTAATSATWAANGVGWTVSASTNYVDGLPYYAFNANPGNRWLTSTPSYNPTYTGAIATTVTGLGSITGEWLQVQSSTPLVLYAYSYASADSVQYDPQIFYVVGSTDGTTWYPIHYCSSMSANPFNGINAPASTYIPVSYSGTQPFIGNVGVTANFTTYPSTTSNPYTYFRVIFKSNFNGPNHLGVGEWYYNFSGGVTYSTNYGTTWTNTGTIATIQTSPSAVSGNGQYTLTSMGLTGRTALVTAGNVASPYAPGSGCVVYYPFNDVAGTTSIAEAIGGYYGSLAGSGTTFGNAGKVGTSVYFNGNGYLTMPSTAYTTWTTLSTGSIACWVNPATITSSPIFTKQVSGGYTNYTVLSIGSYSNGVSSFTAGTPGKIYFTSRNDQYSAGCSSNTVLVANNWYHVVVTFNGTVVQFYINGVLDNTFYCNWSIINTPSAMLIGASGTTNFTGYIDDFSLWNVVLSQSTITAMYTMFMPTLTSINSAIVGTALSHTGQYQVLVTGGATNNVYYSTNYGQTFTGITVGSSLTLLGCTCSFDGSYITVYTASAVYTLNNNRSDTSVSIGYTAGNTNQGANAISIGTYAGLTNQVANSIVLNATGSTMNANATGLFVGPIQPYSVTGISPSTLNGLAYGADNQVVTVPLPLGMGQSYVNQTANRSITAGNVYVNNTGRPMYVMVSAYGYSGYSQQNVGYVYINGVQIYQKYTDTNFNGPSFAAYWDVYFIVPPAATYQVYAFGTYGSGTVNLTQWFELS